MMKTKRRKETQTIEGLLGPCGWDGDGVVLGAEIQTDDEEIYLVENRYFFLKLAGTCLRGSGAISTNKKGINRIFQKNRYDGACLKTSDGSAVKPASGRVYQAAEGTRPPSAAAARGNPAGVSG
jgi:hypothetical protein